jgi:hypothetical protein
MGVLDATELKQDDLSQAPANPDGKADQLTLIVNSVGDICGCTVAAENILGGRQARLVGRPLSEIIPGFFCEGHSPSYRARHLAYLCQKNEWQECEIRGVNGNAFASEFKLSPRVIDGKTVFVLNLRQQEETRTSFVQQPQFNQKIKNESD